MLTDSLQQALQKVSKYGRKLYFGRIRIQQNERMKVMQNITDFRFLSEVSRNHSFDIFSVFSLFTF